MSSGDTFQEGDSVVVKTSGRVLERFPDGDLLVEVDGSELLLRECEVHATPEKAGEQREPVADGGYEVTD